LKNHRQQREGLKTDSKTTSQMGSKRQKVNNWGTSILQQQVATGAFKDSKKQKRCEKIDHRASRRVPQEIASANNPMRRQARFDYEKKRRAKIRDG